MYTYLYIPCVCARGYFYGTMACCESAIPRNRQNVKEATARRNGNDSTERPRTRGGVVGGEIAICLCVCVLFCAWFLFRELLYDYDVSFVRYSSIVGRGILIFFIDFNFVLKIVIRSDQSWKPLF